jgi:predicted lipoprotein
MRFLLGLTLLLLFAAPGEARTIGEKAVENHIRPAYQRLSGAMQRLSQTTAAFCDAAAAAKPDRAALDKAFKEAVLAWAGVEHLRLGPMLSENRYERFAFWPDPKGLGLKQIAAAIRDKDASVTAVETLRAKSVALQGLTAFEVLFWGAEAEKALAKPAERGFICAFAKAIAANLAEISAAVRDEWEAAGGYAANLTAPGPEKLHRDEKEVIVEIFKAFRTGLQQTRNLKLNRVLMGDISEAQPRRAAFWRSGNAVAVIAANVAALRDIYLKGGLYELVRETGEGAEKSTSDEFHILDETLAALVDKPIAGITAAKNSWEKLNSVVFGLINIQKTGGEAITAAAQLPLSFNALDGD